MMFFAMTAFKWKIDQGQAENTRCSAPTETPVD